MEKNNPRSKVVAGLLWRLLERAGAQGVQFIVSVVLARLLAPELFGTIALINVFIAILEVFVDSGLGNSLIQKKDADDLDFSTVFYFNLCVCFLLYVGMFFLAPAIARFYRMPDLTVAVRTISLILIISGVKNVQMAYVSRSMQFKLFFFATLGGTIGAAILGIWMAYNGYGLWALIVQSLFNSAVDTIILWIAVKWRPRWMFSFERLKGLFSYGWKLLASSLLDTGYNKLRQLIIGRIYTPVSLAYFDKGGSFPAIFVNNINSSISTVLFPAMSSVQDNRNAIKSMTRRAITVSSYVMWPFMMGLAACAEPLVSILLTDKWLPCVPYLRIFCITYAFYPIHTANLNAINAMGHSDIFLKLEILKKTVGIGLLICAMWFGVMAIAYSLLLSTVISMLINSWPNRKLLNYTFAQQMKDVFPSMALSAIMFVIVLSVRILHIGSISILLIQIPLGAIIYIAGSKLLKLESYEYVLQIAKIYLKRGNA